jgi:hypothetical protein
VDASPAARLAVSFGEAAATWGEEAMLECRMLNVLPHTSVRCAHMSSKFKLDACLLPKSDRVCCVGSGPVDVGEP